MAHKRSSRRQAKQSKNTGCLSGCLSAIFRPIEALINALATIKVTLPIGKGYQVSGLFIVLFLCSLCMCCSIGYVWADTQLRAIGVLPTYTPRPIATNTPIPTVTSTLTDTPIPTDTPQPPPTDTPLLPGRVQAQVVNVIDGDTIEVSIEGQTHKVRYIGIDTPEKAVEPFGPEAAAKNKELVGGKVVELEKDVSETDQYGRLLRYVYVGDLMVNAELVRLGFAQASAYPPDVKYQDLFLRLQQEAREANRGFWGAPPEPASLPTDTPAVAPMPTDTPPPLPAVECPYIGNSNTGKFHHFWCPSVDDMKEEHKVCLQSREEAIDIGYEPCGNCNP